MRISDYAKFRGKCKEFCAKLVAEDPSLHMVRGHYFCPVWNTEEQHWWCVKPDGEIVDPTVRQFPSQGMGIYTPFSGFIECAECGKEVAEDDIVPNGNYPCCSYRCTMRLVGL